MLFPNGIYTGTSATEVLQQLQADQWNPEDRANVKKALANRAWTLTREAMDEDAPDDQFLIRYAQLGMATLSVTIDGETTTYSDNSGRQGS